MKTIQSFLKENRCLFLFTAGAPMLFLAVFLLYGLSPEPFLYAALLYLLIWLAVWSFLFLRDRKDASGRAVLLRSVPDSTDWPTEARTRAEADYLEMLRGLTARIRQITDEAAEEREEAQDYYTMWVHQIKTPIAAMRMQLSTEEFPNSTQLEAELLRVEQYAEMALHYIRLESTSGDLVFREQPLDEIIRSAIRKYAPLFIARKLRLQYDGTQATVLTDAKWLGFILEQLLSNAVKYTAAGTIRITVSEELVLTVADTGIGIAPEDLPRIFEKGFTGRNGREENRSTGLGLYLCSLAAKKLGIGIKAESEVGRGTAFILPLAKDPVRTE